MQAILISIFGEGKDLTAPQMSSRGIVVFIIALVLIRISGRRSFGVHMPLDNIITISLGAILSRAVVGASGFVPVIVCCFVLVSMHRILGWLMVSSKSFAQFIEGNKILLYQNRSFIPNNMKKALVSEEDIRQSIRKSTMAEDMGDIEKVYMERNGDISTIKKQ